jgi:D-alanyl-lipoteichoic acid acyltransferase DltB (MBOAT superfamily)
VGPVAVGFYLFFAAVFVVYWSLTSGTARKLLLLGSSYLFYALFDIRFLALLAGATAVGFVSGGLIAASESQRRRKAVLAAGLVACLAVLGVFKYLGFFFESAGLLLRSLGFAADPPTLHLVLPIGISFYLFKVMSYLIDVYRGNTDATRSWLDFSTYVAFFPQLLAGPIDRPADLIPQIAEKREFDYALAVRGSRQVLWGIFKKVAIADGLIWSVSRAFGDWRQESGTVLLAGAVLFSFQIYCDFSGYTDISSGLSKLLGITTVRNFAYPYFSANVAEFWRRWNISVSSWFRDYVYISLGGSRFGRVRLVASVMLTFILSGLWHGANYTFLAWGALLGVSVSVTALGGRPVLRAEDTPGGERLTVVGAVRMLATFGFITLSWVFFRSPTIGDAVGILQAMLVFPGDVSDLIAPLALFPGTRKVLLVALVAFVAIEWAQRRHECPLDLVAVPRVVRWVAYTGVFWTTVLLGQPLLGARFIYFDF